MTRERHQAPALDSLIKTGPALLRDLYDMPEPIASVYFAMADPSGDDVALRRRTVRHHLLRAATGTVVLGAVEDALREVPQGPGAVAVFVGRDAAVRTFTMPEADLTTDRVTRSALPDVVPFLRWQQYRPAYVQADLGRTGTEVSVRHSPWSEVTTTTVPTAGDGASVRDYSGYSAETVTEALSGSGARLLIVTGDARAVQSFQDRLPEWVQRRVRVEIVPEGPSTQTDQGQAPAVALAAMVDARLRETVAAVINGSDPENGRDAPAFQGLSDVIRTLARGELRELLVGNGGDASAWFGPGPTDIAETRSELAVPDSAKRHGGVADVLIRAATLTDADVAILPLEMSEALHQGVGGIRR